MAESKEERMNLGWILQVARCAAGKRFWTASVTSALHGILEA